MDISSIMGMASALGGSGMLSNAYEPATYLCKFDENGRRGETHPVGNSMTEEQKQAMLDNGFIEISAEDWKEYVNNQGENGTGMIRDPKTGKPVSAPPYVPTKEELANRLYAELQSDLNELNKSISEAQIDGDDELVADLRQEKEERIAKYEADLRALEA